MAELNKDEVPTLSLSQVCHHTEIRMTQKYAYLNIVYLAKGLEAAKFQGIIGMYRSRRKNCRPGFGHAAYGRQYT